MFAGLSTQEDQLLARRKFTRDHATAFPDIRVNTLAQGKRQRCKDYVRLGKEADLDVVCFDASQNVRSTPASSNLPRLAPNSELAMSHTTPDGLFSKGYVFTSKELSFSMGWPEFDIGEDASAYQQLLVRPSVGFMKDQALLGRSIHLPMLYAWLLYIHMHCIKRDVAMGVQLAFRESSAPSDEPEDVAMGVQLAVRDSRSPDRELE